MKGEFLSDLITEGKSVKVYLINGVKLQGIIRKFSNDYVPYMVLELNGHNQAILVHSIATILPEQISISQSIRKENFDSRIIDKYSKPIGDH